MYYENAIINGRPSKSDNFYRDMPYKTGLTVYNIKHENIVQYYVCKFFSMETTVQHLCPSVRVYIL